MLIVPPTVSRPESNRPSDRIGSPRAGFHQGIAKEAVRGYVEYYDILGYVMDDGILQFAVATIHFRSR